MTRSALFRVFATWVVCSGLLLGACGSHSQPAEKTSVAPTAVVTPTPSTSTTVAGTTASNSALFGGQPIQDPALRAPVLPDHSPRTSVPVVVVSIKAPLTPKPIAFPQQQTAAVPPALAAQVSLYAANLRYPLYILGPRGMTGSGTEGEDGSFRITLAKGAEQLRVFSDGACVGCSVDAAASLFPSAAKAAASYGTPHVVTMQQLGVAVSHPDPQTALFAYKVVGAMIVNGIALYPAFDGVPFLEVEVLTSSADQQLIPWILDSALRVRKLGQ